MNTTAEDERLVQQCLAGDERAWNELIDKYKRLIYSFLVKYGLSRTMPVTSFRMSASISSPTSPSCARLSLCVSADHLATHKCFHWKKHRRGGGSGLEQEVAEDLAAAPEMMQEVQEEQGPRRD